ncbi:MAG: HDIG domain-containing metalloprotein [Candidatus Omnitrophota bacterium]
MQRLLPESKNKISTLIGYFILLTSAYLLGFNMLVVFFIIGILSYLWLSSKKIKYNLYQFSLLILLLLFASKLIIENKLSAYFIPISAIAMLATLLFNNLNIAFLMTIISSILVSLFIRSDLYLFLIFLISGITSVILSFKARRRIQIINAGIIVGIVQVICILFVNDFQILDFKRSILPSILNGFLSSIFVLGTLPIFEYLFGVLTDISLLELTDFNHPLLKRLTLEAPGTYHHSLIVGNLSEAACDAIGANSLLARVGAYYHDIGKLAKPEYFNENQLKTNKHDNISPNLSRMIIMNHVKEGINLGKKYRINPIISSFIEQHHGTSMIYYFYRKAQETGLDKNIKEDAFRYQGPKPKTIETAVVLLADSAEAATRAIEDPTPSKIQETVHKIINNKFTDGQLDECELTLKDLEKIAKTFIRLLNVVYHTRIEYPDENKAAKHTEKNLPKPKNN